MSKFTIRELLLLILALAMGVGWWFDRSILAARVSGLTDQLHLVENALERERANR